jgi:hypothetical protein
MSLRNSIVLALAAGLLSTAHAQTTTATILGVVRDTTGSVVPQATVTARNTQTSFSRAATTDAFGSYLIPNLPNGEYSLSTEKAGFRRFLQEGITLVVNQNARIDVTLSVGQTSETVNVTAQPPDVDTRSATTGEVVDHTRIQELPLNGRNAMALARVVPGVMSVSAPTVITNGRNGPGVTVAGGRVTQNEFRLDGTIHTALQHLTGLNYPSPDALQEFKIITSGAAAEYGRHGGGVFIAVTRSGTNQFHGALWEYVRNKALNARNFFAVSKPDLKQNQYGFTAGGPAIKNRTFFFGSYQATRIRETQLFATATPPTALERTGDFSASARKPRDPLDNQPFAGGIIPSSRFDGVAVKVRDRYLPSPNTPDGRWVALVSQPTDNDQYLWRVDHSFSRANSLNLRFFRDDSAVLTQAGNISPYSPNTSSLLVDNWALHDTHTFSPSLLNEFHAGVNRVDTKVRSLDPTQLSDLGAILPGVTPPQLPQITVNGFFNMDAGLNYLEHGNIYQFGDSVSWFRGRHAAKFGGEFQRTQMINRASTATNAFFTFDGSTAGNAFADFLLGKPISSDQSSPYDRGVNGHNWFLFVQDDWRVSRTLTLNIGLRYEYAIPFYQGHDWTNTYRAGQKSTVTPTAPLGMVFPGDAGVTRGITPEDKNNFAPRVGLAWDPRGDGKLAIRAFYGLFYEDFGATNSTYAAVNQPFVIREFINNPFSLTDPYRGRVNPFPYIFTPGMAKFSFPMGLFTAQAPVFTTPYIHQMSFSVEKSLPGGMVVKGAYVGKLSHNMTHMIQKNPAVYIPGRSTTANTDSRRILMPGIYSSFREINTDASAAYHSLQLSASRHFSNGFTFLTAYTFGKLLDLFSGQTLGNTPQDPYNQRADRARSSEDRTHVFATSFVYEIPFLRHARGALPRAFGGWAISGVVSMASGTPVAVVSNRDNSLTGVGFDRPDLVGNPVRSHSSRDDMIQQFFNSAAFTPNLPGRYGSAGRNLFSGPGQSVTDLSLVKNFVISERAGRVQFRAEAFNAWNKVNFSGPEARLDNRNFGKILSAGGPRIFQFALKYLF